MFLFQDVQYFRRPAPVGAVIERDCQLLFGAAEFFDVKRQRDGLVFFAGEEIRGGIVAETPHTIFGHIRNVPDIAITLEDEIGAGGDVAQFLANSIVGVRGIPDWPDGRISGPESPQRRALYA